MKIFVLYISAMHILLVSSKPGVLQKPNLHAAHKTIFISCPCGNSGETVRIPIQRCLLINRITGKRSYGNCNKRFLQYEDTCDTFKKCASCKDDVYKCVSCPDGKTGNLCTIDLGKSSERIGLGAQTLKTKTDHLIHLLLGAEKEVEKLRRRRHNKKLHSNKPHSTSAGRGEIIYRMNQGPSGPMPGGFTRIVYLGPDGRPKGIHNKGMHKGAADDMSSPHYTPLFTGTGWIRIYKGSGLTANIQISRMPHGPNTKVDPTLPNKEDNSETQAKDNKPGFGVSTPGGLPIGMNKEDEDSDSDSDSSDPTSSPYYTPFFTGTGWMRLHKAGGKTEDIKITNLPKDQRPTPALRPFHDALENRAERSEQEDKIRAGGFTKIIHLGEDGHPIGEKKGDSSDPTSSPYYTPWFRGTGFVRLYKEGGHTVDIYITRKPPGERNYDKCHHLQYKGAEKDYSLKVQVGYRQEDKPSEDSNIVQLDGSPQGIHKADAGTSPRTYAPYFVGTGYIHFYKGDGITEIIHITNLPQKDGDDCTSTTEDENQFNKGQHAQVKKGGNSDVQLGQEQEDKPDRLPKGGLPAYMTVDPPPAAATPDPFPMFSRPRQTKHKANRWFAENDYSDAGAENDQKRK